MKKVILGSIALVGAIVVVKTMRGVAHNEGYSPEQPIPFSHKKHAGQYSVPCLYCHVAPEKSRHSTVPSMNICMNCHSVVATNSPHIQKLRKFYAENRPIEWVRVHNLPDHVQFVHKRHVLKGIKCETCHGDVKEMDRVVQVNELTMGWCLSCHRGLITPAYNLVEQEKSVTPNRYPDGAIAPTNCNTCHQ